MKIEDLAICLAMVMFFAQIALCFFTMRALYDEKYSENFGVFIAGYCVSSMTFFFSMNFLGRTSWGFNGVYIAIMIGLTALAAIFIKNDNEHPFFSWPILYVVACNIADFLGQSLFFGAPVVYLNLLAMVTFFGLPFLQKKS
jgi:FtsH-binding integral membrane protein